MVEEIVDTPLFITLKHSFMEKYFQFLKRAFLFLLTACSIFSEFSCKPTYIFDGYDKEYGNDTTKWVNWNILFPPGTDDNTKNAEINRISHYVSDYLRANYPGITRARQYYVACPCDPTLINYTATPLSGTTGSPVPPPLPKGGGGSGDKVAQNYTFYIDSAKDYNAKLDSNKKAVVGNSDVSDKTIGIMDTGLDPAYFPSIFPKYVWNDPTGKPVIANYLFYINGNPLTNGFDDDDQKHGSAVTALSYEALETMNPGMHPKVMVMKVLDKNRKGNSFASACALSYAFQNKVTIVNASLGYYDDKAMDEILQHYIDTANAEKGKTPIIAAAGNTRGVHPKPICQPGEPLDTNRLRPGRLFFPACATPTSNNLISVTSLSSETNSCAYQNFSDLFVTVGVIANPGNNCCSFKVTWLDNTNYEGSSFATPIVTGKIMGCLLTHPSSTTVRDCLDLFSPLPNPRPNTIFTIQGRSFTYVSP
jgi:hypothetical protein